MVRMVHVSYFIAATNQPVIIIIIISLSPTRLFELKLSWTRDVIQPMLSERGPDKEGQGRGGQGRGAVESRLGLE